MKIDEALNIIETYNIKELALQFTDIFGILHTLWVAPELLENVIRSGMHTDGSSFGMVDVSKSDLKLVPDLETFCVLPENLFPERVARLMCDIYHPESDKPFEYDPRFILKQSISRLKNDFGKDVDGIASSEIEFFVFNKTENGSIKLIDDAGYLASPPADKATNLRIEMSQVFRNLGIVMEKHHHEVPHGKSEFNLPPDEILRMADTIYLVKFIIKLMAAEKGLIASFMPKPFHGEYGAGLHTHINLKNSKTKENLFSDPDHSIGLSKTALQFMGGVLSHAKALAAITNPSVNSYKRLVPGWEAPVYISWANFNRSTLIRIPPGKSKSARIEYRPTDGSCNFYLAYAGLLSAGLDGISKGINPPDPIEDNIYRMNETERKNRNIETLPGTLGDSITEFSKDAFLKESLGDSFFTKYIELKRKEWKDFCVYVHEWERKRYLDV